MIIIMQLENSHVLTFNRPSETKDPKSTETAKKKLNSLTLTADKLKGNGAENL